MKHEPPNAFHATPRGPLNVATSNIQEEKFMSYRQSICNVVNYDDAVRAFREVGAEDVDVDGLLRHFARAAGTNRDIHRTHVILGAEPLSQLAQSAFSVVHADFHTANNGRSDCLVFTHAARAAETYDAVGVLVTDAGYLPMLRHIKSLGARAELHVLPTIDEALIAAADARFALLPTASARHVPANDGEMPRNLRPAFVAHDRAPK